MLVLVLVLVRLLRSGYLWWRRVRTPLSSTGAGIGVHGGLNNNIGAGQGD